MLKEPSGASFGVEGLGIGNGGFENRGFEHGGSRSGVEGRGSRVEYLECRSGVQNFGIQGLRPWDSGSRVEVAGEIVRAHNSYPSCTLIIISMH